MVLACVIKYNANAVHLLLLLFDKLARRGCLTGPVSATTLHLTLHGGIGFYFYISCSPRAVVSYGLNVHILACIPWLGVN